MEVKKETKDKRRCSSIVHFLKPFRIMNKHAHPIDNAGFFSFTTLSWLTPLAWKAFKYSSLEMEDLWNISPHEASDVNSQRLWKLWQEELCKKGQRKASLLRVVWRFFRTRCLIALAFLVIAMIANFCSPAFLIRRLLEYSKNANNNLYDGLFLVLGIFLLEVCHSWTLVLSWVLNIRTGTRLRGALVSLGFQKVLRLRNARDIEVGKLVNMCSSEGQYLFGIALNACLMAGGPFVILLGTIYTAMFLGPTALFGSAIFFLYYPSMVFFSRRIAHIRKKCVSVTDRRVQKMSELLNCIKVIKMYAWEKPFSDNIKAIRKEEHKLLETASYVQSITNGASFVVVVIASACTFILHMAIGYDLDAAQVFTVVTMFTSMMRSIKIVPSSVKSLSEALVSIARFQDLFLMEEWESVKQVPQEPENAIEFRAATLAWIDDSNTSLKVKSSRKKRNDTKKKRLGNVIPKETLRLLDQKLPNEKESAETQTTDRPLIIMDNQKQNYQRTLFNINLNIQQGKLIGICGSVGSGKTSLISAILGQMSLLEGSIAVNGCFAYVAQQAWILNMSLRENVLFGKHYNEVKFKEVLESCSLNLDASSLPYGDMTEIGERGATLSGGQRQRVSLARALYSDQDIILLDDPLSAVDAHVGAHLFHNAIKKCLKGKTVLFVTHQLQYLVECDEVIFMKNGYITEHGTHENLMNQNGEYAVLFRSMHKANLVRKQRRIPLRGAPENLRSLSLMKSLGIMQGGKEKEKATTNKGDLINEMVRDGLDTVEAIHAKDENEMSQRGEANMLPADVAISMTTEDQVTADKSEKSKTIEGLGLLDVICDAVQEKELIEEDIEDRASSNISSNEAMEKGQLIQPEEKATGSLPWSVYDAYIKAAGGYLVSVLNVLLFVLTTGSIVSCNVWLSYWIKQGIGNTTICVENSTVISGSMTRNPHTHFYIGIYGLLITLMLLLKAGRGYVFVKSIIKAGSRLHNQLFEKVIRCPMSFFETTPLGRILKRFSGDMDEVDVHLAHQLELLIQNITMIIFCLVVISAVFPWFLLSVLPLSLLFCAVNRTTRVLIRELKRLDNVTQSPIISLITSALNGEGIPTIHAYGQSNNFLKRFQELLDVNQSPNFLFNCGLRWLVVRLDIMSITIITTTSMFIVLMSGQISPAFAGLAISYAIQLTGLFQFTTRLASDSEARFVSVEKINHYIQTLESESSPNVEEVSPSPEWPQEGHITFKEVEMRYRENLPLALKTVSFEIKPQEKIGIVGRTGAGKSSLGITLFRLVKLDGGCVSIDNVSIANIRIEDLRTRLAVIPQDPTLFTGTIRFNLDPLQQYADCQIWEALERTHMKENIAQLPLKLNSLVTENGENFSVGERQLVCVARALLRHSKILLLDEATAAVDNETDQLIQKTIMEAFSDCTTLIIAHRLNTVLNCNRVMVLDQGQIVEFDTPAVLLSRENSPFRAMLAATENSIQSYD
ncbi:multidrug resistance-associated protein 5 [Protopterus annectens]|uniref:multidrug resistance-associated protein 5 n=1 Tax=Protopterus annectens TaxID=7888 RepID=UPI001CF94146|nr:multidrug resistance-associated protein 5 [Protopterus annectens]